MKIDIDPNYKLELKVG